MKPIRHIKGLLNTALTASILISCLDKYPVSRDLAPENPPLVVEGFIDAGKQTATVVLTRAIPVMDETAPPREANANVRISVSNSETLKLPETEPGLYTLTNLHLDFEKKYSLLITTADGTGFTSDPITLQRTPAIDSITWGASAADDALDIMVNSHDTYGNGKFFIWNFEETWQYHSVFNSELKWVKGQAVPRDPGESVSSCFSTYKSKNILLATNQHLREQVISRVVINQIPKGAQKTQERYSILVNQRVLSPEEFKYQSELKRTTESLG